MSGNPSNGAPYWGCYLAGILQTWPLRMGHVANVFKKKAITKLNVFQENVATLPQIQ